MYNKVLTENPLYKRLRMACVLLFLFAVVFAAVVTVIGLTNSRNLNGSVNEITGVVTFAGEDDNDNYVMELDGDTTYVANPIKGYIEDWDSLVGQTVTIVIPQTQLSSSNSWVLGVKIGENVVVDYNDVTEQMRNDNKIVLAIFGTLVGALIAASGLVYFWQKKTSATLEKELSHAYCEYMFTRQPCSPIYRKLSFVTLAYVIFVVVYAIAISVVTQFVTSEIAVMIVGICITILFLLFTVTYLVVGLYWLPKKEREYYAKNYPFDFTDISHIVMRKRVKAELQKELIEEREKYPDRYGDGGNGYLVEFCKDGLKLFLENPDTQDAPSAQEVFGEGGDTPSSNELICTIDYDTLNFEAIAHYRKKDRPLMVVVKSRLSKTDDLPTDMENDIHILLDVHLLKSLRKYNVQVENLDYILENKAQLIQLNCKKSDKQ